MKKPIQISIPSPCHENWDAMTPADKGRFCSSCQKNVIDFTNSSDREIASVLKNTDNTCGRFSVTQLNRDLVVPKEKSTIWIAASAAIISLLTIGNHTISAQTPVNTEQHISETDEIVGKVAPTSAPERNLISGVVSEKNEGVLPAANIQNANTMSNTQTDINGNFSIKAAIGDRLIVTYVGITSKEIIVTSESPKIIVEMESMGLIYTKRNFFGRVFHSIGNIFR